MTVIILRRNPKNYEDTQKTQNVVQDSKMTRTLTQILWAQNLLVFTCFYMHLPQFQAFALCAPMQIQKVFIRAWLLFIRFQERDRCRKSYNLFLIILIKYELKWNKTQFRHHGRQIYFIMLSIFKNFDARTILQYYNNIFILDISAHVHEYVFKGAEYFL